MARQTLGDIFNAARSYLDTDELNFPNPLLDTLLKRIWFQAITMEREWRFFQRAGHKAVTAGNPYVPMTFDTLLAPTPATRLMTVMWEGAPLTWREASILVREAGTSGTPSFYTELNEGTQRNIFLSPAPSSDGQLTVEFYQEPQYPSDVAVDPLNPYTAGFVDLPPEFDPALLEGVLAEMYMREEDVDLYDTHRSMFLEQMGSIRNRWRESLATPLVMAGRARLPGEQPGGWYWPGYMKQPVAR